MQTIVIFTTLSRAVCCCGCGQDRDTGTFRPVDGKWYGLTEALCFDADSDPCTPGVAKTTTYVWAYDEAGQLVWEMIDHWGDAADSTSTTECFVDANNLTGYAQTVIEATRNAEDSVTKRITYIYGQDEITQATSLIDPATDTIISSETHPFGHDGHGSVRVLYEAAAAIAQVYTYTVYGELLAIHNAQAALSAHRTWSPTP